MRRVTHPDDPWSGHFSFPGGRMDAADDDILQTCFRETREETGIILSRESLQKTLDPEPAGRNYDSPLLVQPYLFSLSAKPEISLEPSEIESACWLDAKSFMNGSLHKNIEMLPGLKFPAFPLQDYYVWGFTYRLLRSILVVRP
ncbi:NUDIX domain-containing protein [Desulforhopalus singaporensis]|uniref:NUDIX domain-containing protein n=1 Tax=Desulforhopalus singaporensis TaxID=91360 RepID=A0A1H0JB11_9BACT|nr:NUDIX domain-containing protein [Desulforhopalus singaporensis]